VERQRSYFQNEQVPYGTKGSTRPDLTISATHHVEVKNYDILTNASSLISTLNKQLGYRQDQLPPGSTQSVVIDARGQGLTQKQVSDFGAKLKNEIKYDINIVVYW
jgi:filamentous hemagglutinin